MTVWQDSEGSLLEFHWGRSGRDTYHICFQCKEKPVSLNGIGTGEEKRERCRGGWFSTVIVHTSPACVVNKIVLRPILVLSKADEAYASHSSQEGSNATDWWLKLEQHHAASAILFVTFSQETHQPLAPISFVYSTLLPNDFTHRWWCIYASTDTRIEINHQHTAGIICNHNSTLPLYYQTGKK